MTLYRSLTVALLVLAALVSGHRSLADGSPEQPRRIAQWGSSVSNGAGDELEQGGYAGRLAALLAPRGWDLVNQSRGGDNTVTITPRFEPGDAPDPDTPYLTSVNPAYVIIGLSLGNEGIARCAYGQTRRCTQTTAEADAIYAQFASGLERLIKRSRDAGIRPVVALAYARSDFSEFEYAYTRRMNLLINSWDVPSINLLGAVDDGYGRWARGFYRDPLHPNAAGHTEMFHAVVPTLFDALAANKPTPIRAPDNGFARVGRNHRAPMTLAVPDVMRSFAASFIVRTRRDGAIAAISGRTVDHTVNVLRTIRPDVEWDSEASELTPRADRFDAVLMVQRGRLVYQGSNGNRISAPLQSASDEWHRVTLTHYVARGETLLYVDAKLAGAVRERLQPDKFVLGGPGNNESMRKAARADYKDWMLHRAGLNADEVAAIHDGSLLQASLELYVPLTNDAENDAQSLSAISVDASAVTFRQEAD